MGSHLKEKQAPKNLCIFKKMTPSCDGCPKT